jgi:integrase
LVAGSSPAGGANASTGELSTQIGEILSFGFWMEKEGYRPATVRSAIEALKSVARRADLLDSEAVKTYLARAKVSEGRKERVSNDILRFYRYNHIPFEKPRYRKIEKLPFLPTEQELEQLIGGMNRKLATFLMLLKQTGLRCGEAWALRWVDVDSELGFVNATPEKNSKPRKLKISSQLIAMLNTLPKTATYVFHLDHTDPLTSLCHIRRNFEKKRKKLAVALQNPRLLQIHFHTLRHWKATTEYHRTKDILHVMQLLGHKNIRNTLVYTHLVNFESDDYICKVAKTIEEAKSLIESGFEFVTDIQDSQLFRKRK